MKVRFVLLLLATIAAGPATLCAQDDAINRREGENFLQVGISWHSADEEYGLDGTPRSLFPDTTRFRNPKFGETDIELYGEIGLASWLTLIGETHYRTMVREARLERTNRDSSISASGLGDIWIRGRVRLLDTSSWWQAAATAAWKAPTGSPLQDIPLGTGVADYAVGAAVRFPFPIIQDARGSVELGSDFMLRHRASNQVDWSLKAALEPGRGIRFDVGLRGVHSLADYDAAIRDRIASGVNTSIVGDVSYSEWLLMLEIPTGDGLRLGAMFSSRFAGRNALASSIFGLHLSWLRP